MPWVSALTVLIQMYIRGEKQHVCEANRLIGNIIRCLHPYPLYIQLCSLQKLHTKSYYLETSTKRIGAHSHTVKALTRCRPPGEQACEACSSVGEANVGLQSRA